MAGQESDRKSHRRRLLEVQATGKHDHQVLLHLNGRESHQADQRPRLQGLLQAFSTLVHFQNCVLQLSNSAEF